MGPVEHGEEREEVVLEAQLQRGVGDGDVKPMLRGVKLLKAECLKETGMEQRTAEAEALARSKCLLRTLLGVEVGEIDLPGLIHCNRGHHTAISQLRGGGKESMERSGLHHHVRLHNQQPGILLQSFLLRRL